MKKISPLNRSQNIISSRSGITITSKFPLCVVHLLLCFRRHVPGLSNNHSSYFSCVLLKQGNCMIRGSIACLMSVIEACYSMQLHCKIWQSALGTVDSHVEPHQMGKLGDSEHRFQVQNQSRLSPTCSYSQKTNPL